MFCKLFTIFAAAQKSNAFTMNIMKGPRVFRTASGPALLCAVMLLYGCAGQRKLQRIKEDGVNVDIFPVVSTSETPSLAQEDTETVRIVDSLPSGNEPLIMNAVLDEVTGEMVPTEELDAAVVISRIYQVAERNGKVELPFEIQVPKRIMDSKWQLRLDPDLALDCNGNRDTVKLESVYVTGESYRQKQLLGYQQYEKFIASIITDSSRMVYRHQLEQFIRRNIPDLYALRTDSTYVSDAELSSRYDVNAQEAIDHYTKRWMVKSNRRKDASRDKMFRKFVKAPIVEEGIRLDTVMVNPEGDYIYRYVQTINTRKDLKYAYITLQSGIYDQDRELYRMPRTDSIEYPISSLSHFVKDITRYKMKTVWRHQEANSSYNIKFGLGKVNINPDLGNNASEMERIKSNLRSLIQDNEFDLDSIIVTASCSPEGRVQVNQRISKGRSRSVSEIFGKFMEEYIDSLEVERGFSIDESGNVVKQKKISRIPFIARETAENWEELDRLIAEDFNLDDSCKEKYFLLAEKYKDNIDSREWMMKREDWYPYVKENLYPKLRVVKFNFNLHRKGMVEEFVQTEEVDTAYARGVQLLRDRDYEGALEILKDYEDYNSAVAYMAMDRNLSALKCLENVEESADVYYLKAILMSRFSRDEEACDYYRKACEADRIYVFRGNLDPEITVLIQKYGLNKELAE